MPDARINGARIWYKETGEGEPVIQIHGAGFGHFNFSTATPTFRGAFAASTSTCAATASPSGLSKNMTWKCGRTTWRACWTISDCARAYPRHLDGRHGGAAVRGQIPGRTGD